MDAASATLRRSWVSEIEPPYRPKSTRGKNAAAPTMPTAKLEPVSV